MLKTIVNDSKTGQTDAPASHTPLVIKNVRKAFSGRTILDDFSLTVNDCENVVVLGKSGAGKSVLIKCIIGLLAPDDGSISVYGQEVVNISKENLDKVRTTVGFLFQGNALYDSMSVRENLEFPLRRHWIRLPQSEVDQMVEEALETINLKHAIDMMPSELSGGMQKRIALARTMIVKPRVMLYDEPTTGLDPVTARDIDELILRFRQKYQTSAIIISHDMNCVKNVSDRVLLLLDGKIYKEGTYEEMRGSSDEKVRQFFE